MNQQEIDDRFHFEQLVFQEDLPAGNPVLSHQPHPTRFAFSNPGFAHEASSAFALNYLFNGLASLHPQVVAAWDGLLSYWFPPDHLVHMAGSGYTFHQLSQSCVTFRSYKHVNTAYRQALMVEGVPDDVIGDETSQIFEESSAHSAGSQGARHVPRYPRQSDLQLLGQTGLLLQNRTSMKNDICSLMHVEIKKEVAWIMTRYIIGCLGQLLKYAVYNWEMFRGRFGLLVMGQYFRRTAVTQDNVLQVDLGPFPRDEWVLDHATGHLVPPPDEFIEMTLGELLAFQLADEQSQHTFHCLTRTQQQDLLGSRAALEGFMHMVGQSHFDVLNGHLPQDLVLHGRVAIIRDFGVETLGHTMGNIYQAMSRDHVPAKYDLEDESSHPTDLQVSAGPAQADVDTDALTKNDPVEEQNCMHGARSVQIGLQRGNQHCSRHDRDLSLEKTDRNQELTPGSTSPPINRFSDQATAEAPVDRQQALDTERTGTENGSLMLQLLYEKPQVKRSVMTQYRDIPPEYKVFVEISRNDKQSPPFDVL